VEFGPERACNCNCHRIIHATTLDRTNQREGSHMDRRLRPRCRHLASYFKRPKSSPVRPLARSWYYCVHFIAKPKAACALRFSWAATSSNLGLRAIMMSFIKPEVHNVSLRCQKRTEPRPQVACVIILMKIRRYDRRQTDTDRHAHHNTPLPYRGRSNHQSLVTPPLVRQPISCNYLLCVRLKLFRCRFMPIFEAKP